MLAAVILVAVFVAVVLAVWACYALVTGAPVREQHKATAYRLEALSRAARSAQQQAKASILKREELGSGRLHAILMRLPLLQSVRQALRQASWRISVLGFLFLCALAGGATLLGSLLLFRNVPLSATMALFGTCLPYLYLARRRRKRLEKFLEQFPEAIDLITRAVRSGHAIGAGFGMIADELEPPISDEFRQAHDEQKFGLSLNQALTHLQERIPVLDVRIFATALAIQREVGGNLAEVLDKIAHTIRERFKLLRQVRVYTAQGRLTGYILAGMPVFLALMLLAINPRYFRILLDSEVGMLMIGLAALLQIVGYFWIRKIVDITI